MRFESLDLNLLRVLDILLQENSVTRTAKRLCVTQQATSGALKRLRDAFDDELLVVIDRSLRPTPLAQALKQPVRDLMLQISKALEVRPSNDAAELKRCFRFAMSDFSTLTIVSPFMAEVSRRAPQVVCEMRPISARTFASLASGAVDFCVLARNWTLYPETYPEDIHSLPLFDDDFVCVMDAENDAGACLTASRYATMPHAMIHGGGTVRGLVEKAWAANGFSPRVVATTDSFLELVTFVVGTPNVAIVPRSVAARLISSLAIRVVECPLVLGRLEQSLYWHGRNGHDPSFAIIRQCISAATACFLAGSLRKACF